MPIKCENGLPYTGPKKATPLQSLIADAIWFRDPVLSIPEEVCTSVHRCSRIAFRTFSPAEYSKHNSQLDLGRVSSVATNQACVEQIIVPYLSMILLNCCSKMFKIVQFYCYSFRTVKWSHSWGVVDNWCTSVDAEKCAKLRASKILRIA